MALSIDELELQAVDYLPAREVMSGVRRRKHCCDGDTTIQYQDNDGVEQNYDGGDGSINLVSGNQVGVGVSALNGQFA